MYRQKALYHVPTVTIATKNINGKVEIRARDNGNGMADAVKERSFSLSLRLSQRGESTGLGLSLAYDIITKPHGGEINVETIERDPSL